MNFPALSRCLILVAITLACCHQADGGKLGSIRGAARGKPKAAKKSSSSARESKNRSRRDRDDTTDRNENDSTVLKLGQILGAVGQSSVSEASNREERSRRPTRPTRPRRPKPHRAQRRSPVAFNFYSHYAAPMPLPTVVEEYHYPVYEVAPAPPVVSYIETPNNAAEGKYLPATDCSVPPLADPPADQSPLKIDTSVDFDIHEPFQIRFEIDYATDEDEVDRSGFGLLLNATGGLGVESGLRIFRESYGEQRDHLWLGDFNVVYELFPNQFSRTRAGIGLNWLADAWGAEAGLNLTLGSDLFAGPIVFSGELDLGTLGDTDLFHGRLTAAWRQGDHLEWFAGYDYLDIGGTEIKGLLGGVRFRF